MIAEGSSKEYLELIAELRTLETALLEVKTLDLAVEQRPQRAALRQAARQCQNSIDSFLAWLSHRRRRGMPRFNLTGPAPARPWISRPRCSLT
jgi:hypothetical protein